MQKQLIIHLTQEDIEDARHFGLDNVLLSLLADHTGTLWCLIQNGPAVEIMEPYRSLRFYCEQDGQWHPYTAANPFLPCALKAEIRPLDPQNPQPQCEVFAAALRQFEPPQENLVKMAHRFFEEYAFDANIAEVLSDNSMSGGAVTSQPSFPAAGN